MSRNWGYTRKFIILKKDFSNMFNYNPKGHGKVELKGIKGSISLSIENAEENNYYNVVLINTNTMEVIGKVYTEENGRGKADLSLNLQDLEAKGFPMDRINGILLVRDSNILLGGYIEKEDKTLENFIKSYDFQLEDTIVEEAKEEIELIVSSPNEPVIVASDQEELLVDELVVEEFVTEEIAVEEFTETEIEVPLEDELAMVEFTEPVVDIPEVETVAMEAEEETAIVDEEITIYQQEAKQPTYQPIESIVSAEPEEECEEEINYDSLSMEYDRRLTQRNQTTNYILSILRFFPYIDPFTISLQGYNWWKIDYQEGIEERGFLPYFSYLVGGDRKYLGAGEYVTAKELLIKYEHYIFGLYNVKDEVKYYIYGVPGDFSKSEHPHNGATGFNTWFEGYELDGYWLLYIDPLSGKVIHPANPMVPIS